MIVSRFGSVVLVIRFWTIVRSGGVLILATEIVLHLGSPNSSAYFVLLLPREYPKVCVNLQTDVR